MNSEAVIYQEFTNALSNPVLLGIVDFSPLEGSIIIELAQNLGYAIVDRMLGGEGNPLEKSRDFTEIELAIIERIYNVITNLLAASRNAQKYFQVFSNALWRISTGAQNHNF